MVKILLAGTFQPVDITLQVQNGSGVVGIAEEAGEVLAQLGYDAAAGQPETSPMCGAPDRGRPDAAAQGRRVRDLLRVGTVSEKASLEAGRVVVVLGKDYVP